MLVSVLHRWSLLAWQIWIDLYLKSIIHAFSVYQTKLNLTTCCLFKRFPFYTHTVSREQISETPTDPIKIIWPTGLSVDLEFDLHIMQHQSSVKTANISQIHYGMLRRND